MPPQPGPRSGGRGAGLVGAAALIAGLTVLARLTGFGRILVFSRTVGQTCLGDTYQSVNTVPNIVFEIVAGGALASLVVPLLAGAVVAGDARRAGRISSALLTWAILGLAPLAVAVAVFAEPIAGALLGAKGCPGAVAVGASMLRVFAPQVVLYGVGIVLTGILQAHRRFGGPAVAPLLSSLVVIAAYLTFGATAGVGADVGGLSTGAELLLSVGTTLGVAVLALGLLPPLARLGLPLRPTLRFPVGVAPRARRLAAAGVAALAAQQVSVVVWLVLANGAGVPAGSVTVTTYAQTIYLLPWAVLAVPVATSVFPRLAQRWEAGDRPGYTADLAGAVRVVVVSALWAVAVLVAAAQPVARVVVEAAPGRPSVAALTAGVGAFAVGLPGYGLYAVLSRALYARGEAASTAAACVAGWLAVVGADLVLAVSLPREDRVLALAAGNSAGMLVLGALLIAVVLRRDGRHGLPGVARSAVAGLIAAVLATVGGLGLAGWLGDAGVAASLGGAGVIGAVRDVIVVGLGVTVMFGLVLRVVDAGQLRAARSAVRRGAATPGTPGTPSTAGTPGTPATAPTAPAGEDRDDA